jgi:hypothetical protein
MKYLYLIIRHIFPKKRPSIWKIKEKLSVINSRGETSGVIYVLTDQFGNIKQTKVSDDDRGYTYRL